MKDIDNNTVTEIILCGVDPEYTENVIDNIILANQFVKIEIDDEYDDDDIHFSGKFIDCKKAISDFLRCDSWEQSLVCAKDSGLEIKSL